VTHELSDRGSARKAQQKAKRFTELRDSLTRKILDKEVPDERLEAAFLSLGMYHILAVKNAEFARAHWYDEWSDFARAHFTEDADEK
jgi:hypothetical protein